MDESDNAPEFPGSSGQPPGSTEPPSSDAGTTPDVGDAIDATRRLLAENQSMILGIFGLYAALLLMGSVLGVVVSLVTGVAELQMQPEAFTPDQFSDPASVIDMMSKTAPLLVTSVIYGLISNGFYAATFKPARNALFGESTPGFVAAVGQLGGAFGKGVGAAIVHGAIVWLGLAFCFLPGVIAYFFLIPFYYLVCGRGESVFASVETSFSWAKEHAGIVAMVVAVQAVMFLVTFCMQGATSGPILESMGKPGLFVTSLISWFLLTVTTFPVWLLTIGSMATIEKAEPA